MKDLKPVKKSKIMNSKSVAFKLAALIDNSINIIELWEKQCKIVCNENN